MSRSKWLILSIANETGKRIKTYMQMFQAGHRPLFNPECPAHSSLIPMIENLAPSSWLNSRLAGQPETCNIPKHDRHRRISIHTQIFWQAVFTIHYAYLVLRNMAPLIHVSIWDILMLVQSTQMSIHLYIYADIPSNGQEVASQILPGKFHTARTIHNRIHLKHRLRRDGGGEMGKQI